MYDNSRVPSYTSVSSRPCRVQYSRWSLNTAATGTAMNQTMPQSTSAISSSFYIPQSQPVKQKLTPDYVNIYPQASLSSSHLSNYQRPKSTNFHNFTSSNQSTFRVNDLRQNYVPKTIVGIVKPMIHQRSYTELNNNNNNNKNNDDSKISELMIDSYHHNSTRSLYPPPPTPTPPLPPPPPSTATSSVIYRSRPTPSYNNSNGQPPMAPRRHSSISNSKCLSSHRSSRTTSTSSSIAAVNELLSTTSSHEKDQQQQQQKKNDDKIVVDVKRLEMFYGSVGTLVRSSSSKARLYTTTTRKIANFEDWSCQQYGVPVWIYNTGANLKRTRQVRLLLAQHESCFAVWSSLVSDQAELRIPKDNFITCWLPESNLLVVFKFEYDDACRLFFRHYYEILEHERRVNLANPPPLPAANIIQQQQQQQQQMNISTNTKEIPRRYSRLRTISTKHDKEQQQQQFDLRRCRSLSKIRTVKKSDISGPINFEHVNHISSGCNQERPSLGTTTLRSLHASMSHLPSNGTLVDRCSKQSKKLASTLFEPRTTAV